jgi:hypothetical protein
MAYSILLFASAFEVNESPLEGKELGKTYCHLSYNKHALATTIK